MDESALARPTDAGPCGVAFEIARQHGILLLEAADEFVREHGCGADLVTVVASARRLVENDFDFVWDPSFGSLHAMLTTADPEAIVGAVVQVGLRCAAWGATHEIDREIVRVPSLRFDRWTIPNVVHVRIDPRSDIVGLRTGAGSVTIGRSPDHGFQLAGDVHENPIANVLGRRIICLFKDNLLCPGGADIRDKVVDGEIVSLPQKLDESLELLSRQSPRYFGWVTALLRAVAPWDNPLKSIPGGSGSGNLIPGIVAISAAPAREPMIDSLIHEICHHYFYLAIKLGKVADDPEGRLFYNPILACGRPIAMILLAFHAFANVYRYCVEATDRGVGDREYFAARMAALRSHLPVLDGHLASCRCLTALGQSLWLPLHDELADMLTSSAGARSRP